MDIEAAFTTVKTALEEIATYEAVKTVLRHPDVWVSQNATFPILSLIFSEGKWDHERGDNRWTTAARTRMNLECHLVITEGNDNLSLELLRQFVAIQDKIIALTRDEDTLFRCYIASAEAAYAESGKWVWAIITIVIGE
jgi:hypothetical protein